MFAKDGQDQTVEKDPFVLKEFVQEEAHVLTGYNRCEQPKDPLTCIHLSSNVMLNKMALKLGKIDFYQKLDHLAMFEEAWELWQVYVSHLTVFNKCNKKPESKSF